LAELKQDMEESGWNGRPILVIERDEGEYFAWTGTHRIAAAIEAGLSEIPCYVLHERLLEPYGVDAEWGHVEDRERLDILTKVGDETALRLMWLENRS
jgi:hypothetical protein